MTPKAPRFIAVDGDVDLGRVHGHVVGDILHAGQLFDQVGQLVGLVVELGLVGGLHGELVQALGDLAADADGGRILQVDLHAGEGAQFGAQFLDDLVDSQGALIARLEMHHKLAVIGPAHVGGHRAADRGGERFHIRVLRHGIGDLLLVSHHLVIRSAFTGFGDDGELVGILIGDEAFGDLDEHVHGGAEHQDEAHHHGHAMAQGHLQRDVVGVQHSVEEFLGDVVEPAAFFFVRRLEEAAAQHGREGDRHHAGDQDGHA